MTVCEKLSNLNEIGEINLEVTTFRVVTSIISTSDMD